MYYLILNNIFGIFQIIKCYIWRIFYWNYIILNNILETLMHDYVSIPNNITWLLKVTLFSVTEILHNMNIKKYGIITTFILIYKTVTSV